MQLVFLAFPSNALGKTYSNPCCPDLTSFKGVNPRKFLSNRRNLREFLRYTVHSCFPSLNRLGMLVNSIVATLVGLTLCSRGDGANDRTMMFDSPPSPST